MATENANFNTGPIPRVVTVGRAGLLLAGIIALLAAILDLDGGVNIPFLLRLFGALALLICTIAAMIRPLRALDVGTVALAALLAGAASVWAFDPYEISVISLFAWFLLLGFGGAVAAGLISGPPIVDRAFSSQMANLFSAGQTSPLPPPSGPTGPPVPPAEGETPSAAGPAETASDDKPAGWYAQDGGGTARWWDGSAWTEHTRPLPGADAKR